MMHKSQSQATVTVSNLDSEESSDEDLGPPSNSEVVPEGESLVSSQDTGGKNFAWADAIANVLTAKKPKNKKSVILSKAKKDTDVRKKNEEKLFDVVDLKGEVRDVEYVKKAKKRKTASSDDSGSDDQERRHELHKRKNKKLLWENMNRVKPDPLNKDKERNLAQIATKGVVQLFNAVRQHQKKLDSSLKSAGNSEVKQDKVMKSVSKGAFLDLLKGCPSEKISNLIQKSEVQKTKEISSEGSTWSVLKEDFLLGASLKDWDKPEVAS